MYELAGNSLFFLGWAGGVLRNTYLQIQHAAQCSVSQAGEALSQV